MITGVLPACSSLTLGSLFIVNLDKSTLGRSRLLFSTVNSLCIRSKTSAARAYVSLYKSLECLAAMLLCCYWVY